MSGVDTAVLGDEDVFKARSWDFHRRMFWKVRAMPSLVTLSGVGLEDVLVIACVLPFIQLLHLALGVIFDDLVPLEVRRSRW